MDAHLHFGLFVSMCLFLQSNNTILCNTHTHTHTEELSGLQSADAGRQLGVRRLPSLISRYEVTDGCVPSVKKEKKKWTLTCTPADAASIHKQQPETVFTYRATHTHTGSDSPQRADTLLCSTSDGMWWLRSPLDWVSVFLDDSGRKLRMYLHHWCRRNQENKVLVPIRDVCGWVAVLEGSAESGSTFARRAYFHYFEFMKEKDKNKLRQRAANTWRGFNQIF